MNCALPSTGGPSALLIAAGLLCLVVGWMLVRRRRPGKHHGAAALVLLVIAAGFVVAQPSPGRAADACNQSHGSGDNGGGDGSDGGGNDGGGSGGGDGSGGGGGNDGGGSGGGDDDGAEDPDLSGDVVIAQTSTMGGMTPGSAPAMITGTVENTSLDSTYVTDVTVRITSVSEAADSAPGTCSPDDFVLSDPVMSVEEPLPELSTVTFAGATLGLKNTSVNQDACKRATVHLGYVSGSR